MKSFVPFEMETLWIIMLRDGNVDRNEEVKINVIC